MNAQDFLKTVPFFAETLSGDQLHALAAAGKTRTLAVGSTLIREDDRSESMFVITEGEVTVTIREAGKESRVATLGKGEIVGEMSLLTGARRSATVRADTPVTALEIDRKAIGPFLIDEPALFDRFAETLENRRVELDRVYGPMAHFYGAPHDDLAIVIRTFFSEPRKAG